MSKNSSGTSVTDWHFRIIQKSSVRLLLIPFIAYVIWLFEMYLLEGQIQLFQHPDPVGLLFYTLICCIAIGIVIPVLIIRRSFVGGDVTMYQLGFRSWYRTVLAVVLTFLVLGLATALQNPFGDDTSAFFLAFLLLLPTGIATVIICWVLVGTHIQALVRGGGALLSIPAGVAITAILFGLASKAQFPMATTPDTQFWYIVAGMVAAVFFFLVRDVWSTAVFVTGELVYLVVGWYSVPGLYPVYPAVLASAALSVGALIVIHWYLSRHFLTIAAPVT
jgi:hypothetical protein